MARKIIDWFKSHEWAALALIAIVFLALRLPGVHLPLHQDEYKWPIITNPATAGDASIPHPPLGEAIYRFAGHIVGYNVNFRFVPLLFGFLNLFLLYYLVRMMFGRREAIFSAAIFAISYFSILASLMVDTDGQILPFFFLLSSIAYFKVLRADTRNRKIGWGIALAVFILGGFLVKASFAIAAGALVLHFAWQSRGRLGGRQIAKYLGYLAGAIVLLVAIFLILPKIFPFFSLSSSLAYWEHFFVLSGRQWGQTFIETSKAILYTSPLLIAPLFFLSKKRWNELSLFVFFLGIALVFYLIIFDFSTGALDRYFQFDIVPLAILSGIALSDALKGLGAKKGLYAAGGIALALFLFNLQSIQHSVPALYPKALWLHRLTSFHWNFEFVFSGGSGPLGFYVSFLFMALTWIAASALVIWALADRKRRAGIVLMLVIIALSYNLVFAEEYLFGKLNGFAPKLVQDATAFIAHDPDIKKVVVYNDNGGYEIQQTGKYEKRLYTSPEFNLNDKVNTINAFSGHYLEVDIPRIDPASVYRAYLDSCKVVYKETDKKISATVYDCRGAPKIKL